MTVAVRVRSAVPTDAQRIVELLEQLGYDTGEAVVRDRIERLQANAADSVYVAEHQGSVVGVLTFHVLEFFHEPGWLGRITSFVVDQDSRGLGVGRLLTEAAEADAWRAGCTRIEVTSGDARTGAHAFYERNGYSRNHPRLLKYRPVDEKT